MPENMPGDGFLGWLGRQIGHVKQAVKTKVQAPASTAPPATQGASSPAPEPQPAVEPPPAAVPPPSQGAVQQMVVYRDMKIEEIPMPDKPGVLLRRTIIDEAIMDPGAPRDDSQRTTDH